MPEIWCGLPRIQRQEKSAWLPLRLVASPLNLSETPVTYRLPPPLLGEHTEDIFTALLGFFRRSGTAASRWSRVTSLQPS